MGFVSPFRCSSSPPWLRPERRWQRPGHGRYPGLQPNRLAAATPELRARLPWTGRAIPYLQGGPMRVAGVLGGVLLVLALALTAKPAQASDVSVTTELRPGWNLAGWTAGEAGIDAVFSALPSVLTVYEGRARGPANTVDAGRSADDTGPGPGGGRRSDRPERRLQRQLDDDLVLDGQLHECSYRRRVGDQPVGCFDRPRQLVNCERVELQSLRLLGHHPPGVGVGL